MDELTKFERDVLYKMFEGVDPVLAELRELLKILKVSAREMTGVGFYVAFAPNRISQKITFNISDVFARIAGLENGAGFVLFVEHGALKYLEGFSFDERWPERIVHYELGYRGTRQKDFLSKLIGKT